MEEKIAIIDLGSNSARVVLVRIIDGGYFTVFDELKETVRLAQDMDDSQGLNKVRVEEAIKTLQMFKKLCDSYNIDNTKIFAYATAAVRRAKNQRTFLETVYQTCGFRLKVLEQDEECKLVYTGVINSMDIPKGLIMDIGGGSTQLIYYVRRSIIGHVTLPYGSVTLTEMFKDLDLTPEQKNNKIEAFFAEQLKSVPFLNELDKETVFVGVGGAFRNLGKMSRLQRNYPLTITQNYQVSNANFRMIYSAVKTKHLSENMKIEGLSSVRADIFPSALAAINAVMNKCKFDEIVISGSGLREGVMYHQAMPSTKEKPIPDILGYSIYTILHTFGENIQHAEHIYDLCIKLYNNLKVLHKLPKGYVKILRTAAMLHDTGNRINYYSHQKHSQYIILHSKINGMTHRDLVMAAFIAGQHRKKPISLTEFARYRDLIDAEDIEIIKKLGVLLRIAESLDRSQSGNVTDICCDILGESVIMKVISQSDCQLEIKDALTATNEFKKAYKKNLQILV